MLRRVLRFKQTDFQVLGSSISKREISASLKYEERRDLNGFRVTCSNLNCRGRAFHILEVLTKKEC